MTLTPEQKVAGLAALAVKPYSHYRVWRALVDAGVPVRAGRATPASTEATALVQEQHETALREISS